MITAYEQRIAWLLKIVNSEKNNTVMLEIFAASAPIINWLNPKRSAMIVLIHST